MDVNKEQLAMMKHAIGWQWENKPYRKRLHAYRNRYVLSSVNEAFPMWNDLVGKGYAVGHEVKGTDSTWFRVTTKGVKLIESIYRIHITQDKEDIVEDKENADIK